MIAARTRDREMRGTIRSSATEAEPSGCNADSNPAPRKRRRVGSGTMDAQQQQHLARPQLDDLPNEILALVLDNVEWAMRPVVPFVCRRWRALFAERAAFARSENLSRSRREPAKYCATLAAMGYIGVIAWARANGCPWDARTCRAAVEHGNFEVFKWARDNGCPCDNWACAHAAQRGDFEMLKWARANGCPWSESTCVLAVEAGRFDILQWAHANGCLCGWATMRAAAKHGRFDILQWARANGASWNAYWSPYVCADAARIGRLDIVQWAHADGCPWEWPLASWAAGEGHLDIVKWARAEHCEWKDWIAWDAAKAGHLDVLVWIHDNWHTVLEPRIRLYAKEPAVVAWLDANDCPQCPWFC
ncbi:Ankyrin repeat domain containing protein [Pandoravirus salinus]|uniref:Ankyrin repeat domain containing protein n=1 Tax=Pandoravirus salinus TaxID=1349410 RepID=A0A291ATI3_9VIRU|nr:ankyrin repeat domain [Pandoravirus salinus]ATE82202.1 Ankyrin repeat domain containing protein [Pandoravirus salinus]